MSLKLFFGTKKVSVGSNDFKVKNNGGLGRHWYEYFRQAVGRVNMQRYCKTTALRRQLDSVCLVQQIQNAEECDHSLMCAGLPLRAHLHKNSSGVFGSTDAAGIRRTGMRYGTLCSDANPSLDRLPLFHQ